jgi:thiol-disulfide isomerase/thioredoxin
MNPRQLLLLALLGLMLGGGISAIYRWQNHQQQVLPENHLGAIQLPDFSLPNIDGSQWRAEEWRNRVLVINFWATWCPPCLKEMPLFIRLQEQFADRGVLFVGIAIDDQEDVQNFIDTYGIEFPILLGESRAMQLAQKLGNRFNALPFTVIADRGGKILLRQGGEMTEKTLLPLLENLVSDQ